MEDLTHARDDPAVMGKSIGIDGFTCDGFASMPSMASATEPHHGRTMA